MKRHLTIVTVLALVLLSACSNANHADPSLLVDSISYNLGASVFETQYVYKVADIEFEGDFSEELKNSYRSKYVLVAKPYEPGERVEIDVYSAGEVYVTLGEKALDLRPQAIEKEDTYLIYGYRHTYRDEVQLVDSLDNLYNVIWECAKEFVLIQYTYK